MMPCRSEGGGAVVKLTQAQRHTMKCDLCDREYDADNASQCGKCRRIVCPECWGHDADPGRLDGYDGYCYKCEPFAPAETAALEEAGRA